MQDHLNDQQWAELLLGTTPEAAAEHLKSCEPCRRQHERLQRALAALRQASSPEPLSEAFWEHQRTAILERLARQRIARTLITVAATAALVLLSVWTTGDPGPQPVQFPSADPDHALLVEVERILRRDLPRPLEPATLLAQEMSRAMQAQSNSDTTAKGDKK